MNSYAAFLKKNQNQLLDVSDDNRTWSYNDPTSLCFSQFEVHCGSWNPHAPLCSGVGFHAGVSAAERWPDDPWPPCGRQRPGTPPAPQTQTPNVTFINGEFVHIYHLRSVTNSRRKLCSKIVLNFRRKL